MSENEMAVAQEESKSKQRRSAKAYLSQAYKIDIRINSKLEQIASLRSLATKATGVLSDMPKGGSGSSSRMEEIVGKIVDLEAEINEDIKALVDFKAEAIQKIKLVDKPDYQTVLELRHLCYHSWEDISAEMHFSIPHLHTLHNAALVEFSKTL